MASFDIDPDVLSDLIARVYAAGLEPARWRDFLDAFDREMDGAYLSLYGHDLASNLSLPTLVTRYPDDRMAAYHHHYAKVNPFVLVLYQTHLMRAQPSEQWIARTELLKSEFYNDFLAPQEDIGTGGGGVVFFDKARVLILSGQIRFRDEDAKGPKLIGLINLLMPHVRQAFAVQRRLDLAEAGAAGAWSVLDRAASAVLLLDRAGRALHMNAAAAAAIGETGVLCLARDGTVSFRSGKAEGRFRQALGAALASAPGEAADPFRIEAEQDPVRFASVLPLGRGASGESLLPDAPEAAVVCLIISAPRPVANAFWPAYVADRGLSGAEAALARALVAGRSLADYAKARGASLHTVRTQAKALYAKTGARGQADLVAMLARYFY